MPNIGGGELIVILVTIAPCLLVVGLLVGAVLIFRQSRKKR